jgi:hypothetical protein
MNGIPARIAYSEKEADKQYQFNARSNAIQNLSHEQHQYFAAWL